MTLKLAVIDPLGGHGGHHYYVADLATGLQRAGIETIVYTVQETPITGNEPYKVIITFKGLFGRDLVWWRGLRFLRGLFSAVFAARRAGCCVAHIHSFHCNITEVLSVTVSRLSGMKVLLTLHDVESFGRPGQASLRHLMFRLASALIVHNEFSRVQLDKARGAAGVERPVHIIPHGHYAGRFESVPDRAQARAHLGLPPDKLVFLFFGNPRWEKGLDLLLQAMAVFRGRNDVQLLVAGKMKPPEEEYHRKLVSDLDLGDLVRMDIGHVSDTDIPFYYRAADVGVVPYRSIYESGVTLMLMTFCRAVLASDLPVLVELTGNGERGLLFKSENVADLSRALEEAHAKRSDLDSLGERGNEYVRNERDWDVIGRKTADVLRTIAASRG